MFKNTLLAMAAGGALMIAALTGSAGTAEAGTSVQIGIGVPGVQLVHSRERYRCWLPESHLCGPHYGRPAYGRPIHGRPIYGRPIYAPPVYGRPVYGRPVYGWPGYWAPPVYHGPVYRRW